VSQEQPPWRTRLAEARQARMGRPEVAAAYEQTRLRYELGRPARCCGNCLPAGAGLLTWWRRPAPRASARQGAAGRGRPPAPESARCPQSRPATGFVRVPARAVPRCSRVAASELGYGRTAWRAEGVPVNVFVKKVLTVGRWTPCPDAPVRLSSQVPISRSACSP
jgi:hypothetical protein